MTVWKKIPGFSMYEVSDTGLVRRSDKLHPRVILKPRSLVSTFLNAGYQMCHLLDDVGKRRMLTCNHIVALAFVGPRPSEKHDALHWDDNRSNNNPTNIRWGTDQDNANDKIRNGRQPRGQEIWSSKLTPKMVKEIRTRYKPRNVTAGQLSKAYGIGMTTVYSIVRNKNWKHIK